MLDWAPISKGEVEHNVNPYERMECNKVNVKAALEAFRQPIAVGAHFNCVRCNEFLSHADMASIRPPPNVRDFTSEGQVVQSYD